METFAKPNFYVTTAIDYTNANPHIGHSLQKVAADVLARWHRSLGENVFFLTGTDEHGLKIQRAAEAAGKTPKQLVDELAKEFQSAWDALNINYDIFYRTTNTKHKKLVQKFIEIVNKNGDIYKGHYEGKYCVSCENYLSEDDIVDGKCKIHKKSAEYLKEECYFFKLSKYQKKLLELYEKYPKFIQPESRKHEIVNRVKAGLQDLSISRTTFNWGIPFPLDKKHVTYVWFDALTNYITALDWPSGPKFKKFWPANVHLLGKDNGWFHTVIWPAMLLSAGIELPKTVYVHGFLTFNGEKISKSLGNVIDPRVLAKKYGADAYRYYILRENSIAEDGDFSEKALVNRINTDLANSLGNLLSRTLTLIEKFSHGKIPKPKKQKEEDLELYRVFEDKRRHASEHIDKFEFHHALEKIWDFINFANKYVNDEKPWELANKDDKESKEHLHTVLYNCTEALRLISALVWPFIPETAEEIAKQLGIKVPHLKNLTWGKLKPGIAVKKGKILFEKVEYKEERVEPFTKLDIRCAEIKEVEDIEGADKLYKLRVNLGKLGKRIVVAGIKRYYKKEELKGKKIALLANLEPAVIRGVKSEGMILAASEGDKVEGLFLHKTEPGEKIFIKGFEGEPDKVLPYSEFEKVAISVHDGKIMHDNKQLQSEKEHLKVSLKQGRVK